MDTILIQRQSGTVALHPKHIQDARDLPGNAAGDIRLDPVIDQLFQPVLVGDPSILRKKGVVDADHGMLRKELLTKQCLVDGLTVIPCGEVHGNHHPFYSFSHSLPPLFCCPHDKKWGQLSIYKKRRLQGSFPAPSLAALPPVGARNASLLPDGDIFVLSAHSIVKEHGIDPNDTVQAQNGFSFRLILGALQVISAVL